jgi:hypothetical protein
LATSEEPHLALRLGNHFESCRMQGYGFEIGEGLVDRLDGETDKGRWSTPRGRIDATQ